jgi:hypothetical protein
MSPEKWNVGILCPENTVTHLTRILFWKPLYANLANTFPHLPDSPLL